MQRAMRTLLSPLARSLARSVCGRECARCSCPLCPNAETVTQQTAGLTEWKTAVSAGRERMARGYLATLRRLPAIKMPHTSICSVCEIVLYRTLAQSGMGVAGILSQNPFQAFLLRRMAGAYHVRLIDKMSEANAAGGESIIFCTWELHSCDWTLLLRTQKSGSSKRYLRFGD